MLCKTVISISHYGRILLLVTFNVYSSLVLVVLVDILFVLYSD